jgi:glycosyltransferase involved in cell wall biosynthesis/protein-tyrosine-phosphatase
MTPHQHDLPAAAVVSRPVTTRRLRVCHVMSADLWAGAEVQLATTASYLVKQPDVELTAVLFNDGPLAAELRRLGVPVTILDERRRLAIGILRSLTRVLREHPVDVVHTHRYKDTVLGGIAARAAGVPALIRTVHGRSEALRGWQWTKFQAYAALDRLVLARFADHIIAVSGRIAESLARRGYPPGTVVHIPNGVDLRKIRPSRSPDEVRRELGIAPGSPLVGTVGRLSPVKGQAHFLRAASLVLRKERGARFVIVGDGPLRRELVAASRQLRIDHACVFVGERTDVYDLVAAMDVFVLPSLDEGIPMALLEAMALGTPVVATAVGGVPDVVTHRASGLLVDPGDEQGLAEGCLELARDPDYARTLGGGARRIVQEAFSHERSGQALVDIYRGVTLDPIDREGHPSAHHGTRGRVSGPRPRGLLRVVPSAGGDASAGSAASRPADRPEPGTSAARPPARERVRELLGRGASKLRETPGRALARWQMEQIRREPSALATALRSASKILIVCQGNIIRSPFTARLAAQALGGDGRVSICSGGLAATPGTPSPPPAILAAARRDVDLSGHAAFAVTSAAVATSDVVFVMDLDQLRLMQNRFPDARAKVFLLSCLAPEWPLEVRDPFGGEAARFEACYAHIAASIRPIVRLLAQPSQGQ